jgi:hypothetical protein
MRKVAPYAATPDPTYGRQAAPPAHEQVTLAEEEGVVDGEADLRLLIEEDPVTGAVLYKRIDRRTGEVVAEFSHQDILSMRENERYSAGKVIKTRA